MELKEWEKPQKADPKKFSKDTWITKDGRKIKIKDLSENHIYNIVRMLNRSFQAETLNMVITARNLNGDVASYHADEVIAEIDEAGPAGMFPIYESLAEEMLSRDMSQDLKKAEDDGARYGIALLCKYFNPS